MFPQETTANGLQFSPSVQPLAADVLVFINDDLDQTEVLSVVSFYHSLTITYTLNFADWSC